MSETAYVSDIFQLIDMKVLITEDSLDSLLSIKISQDGGKTYTDHSVSSLKNGGITFDCNPNDLKVICDANVLKYIQVLADGEKATSNVDLSDYIKFRDIYIDVYKNPYYGVVNLTDEELSNLSDFDRRLYSYRDYERYCSCENFELYALDELVSSTDGSVYDNCLVGSVSGPTHDCYFMMNGYLEKLDIFYYLYLRMARQYLSDEVIQTNVRVHFIKHF